LLEPQFRKLKIYLSAAWALPPLANRKYLRHNSWQWTIPSTSSLGMAIPLQMLMLRTLPHRRTLPAFARIVLPDWKIGGASSVVLIAAFT
jgi:hypothetical protein